MRLFILFLLPGFLFSQTIEQSIESAVRKVISEETLNRSEVVHLIDSIVRAVNDGKPGIAAPSVTEGFVWVNTQTQEVGSRVGGPVRLSGPSTIHSFGVSGPVMFRLSGPINVVREEGTAPFALFGDIGSRSTGQIFPAGSYELTATHPGGTLKASFQVLQ